MVVPNAPELQSTIPVCNISFVNFDESLYVLKHVSDLNSDVKVSITKAEDAPAEEIIQIIYDLV